MDLSNHFVFKCVTASAGGKKTSAANAVLIDKEKGIFVTNRHVAESGRGWKEREIYIGLPHTRRLHMVAKTWLHPEVDLACLQLKTDLSPYPSVPINPARPKDITFDNPMTGRIQGYAAYDDVPSSAPINIYAVNRGEIIYEADEKFIEPGRSGSAVLDDEGRLIGIHYLQSLAGGTAVPSDRIQIPPSMQATRKTHGYTAAFHRAVSTSAWFFGLKTNQKTIPWPTPTP